MLPHITFPLGILDRFYYLKEIIECIEQKFVCTFEMEKIIFQKFHMTPKEAKLNKV
jgi:hypothetical protein